jgi:hypothetical protein
MASDRHQKNMLSRHWWLIPVTLAIQEAVIRRIEV